MTRSTNLLNENFQEIVIIAVWNKGIIVPGVNPALGRKDICGACIDFDKYGDTTSQGHGWEIDHIIPKSQGGSDHISNLQPLQWQNNRAKGDTYPWKCTGNNCAVIAAPNNNNLQI